MNIAIMCKLFKIFIKFYIEIKAGTGIYLDSGKLLKYFLFYFIFRF